MYESRDEVIGGDLIVVAQVLGVEKGGVAAVQLVKRIARFRRLRH